MGVVTTRPNATPSNNWAVVGGANAHTVLSDNDDASHIDAALVGFVLASKVVKVQFATPSLPAGAIPKQVSVRLRSSRVAPPSNPFRLNALELIASAIGLDALVTNYDVTWKTPTTTTVLTALLDQVPATPELDISAASATGQNDGSLFEAYLDLLYVAPPTVDTVSVVPASPITTDDTPKINWTETLDTDGGPQTFYQVKVFQDAQYLAGGFDPTTSFAYASAGFGGVVQSSDRTWTVDTSLPDDTYRAYVRVGQTVGDTTLWSAWSYVQFDVTIPHPANPVWAQAPTADPDNGRISFVVNAGTGGAATTDDKQVQRSLDGSTWEDIRTTIGDGMLDASGDGQVRYDYEAPNGVPVYYRARAVHTFPNATSTSDWVVPT